MRLFNWFSSQLERRVMMKEMDRLRADLSEAERQLHMAERDSAAAYWESVARDQQKRIAELRRLSSESASAIETTEPAESELERKAWELWLRGDDSIEGVWRKAELWLHARESKRNEKESQQ